MSKEPVTKFEGTYGCTLTNHTGLSKQTERMKLEELLMWIANNVGYDVIDLRSFCTHVADEVEPVYVQEEGKDEPTFKGYRIVRGVYQMRNRYANRTLHFDRPAFITSQGNVIRIAPGFRVLFGNANP